MHENTRGYVRHQNCLQYNRTSLVVSAHGQQAYRYMSCVPCPQQTTHHLTSLTSTGGTASTRPEFHHRAPADFAHLIWLTKDSRLLVILSEMLNSAVPRQHFSQHVHFLSVFRAPNRLCTTWPCWPSCTTSTLFTARACPIGIPCPWQTVHCLTSALKCPVFRAPNRLCTTWPQHIQTVHYLTSLTQLCQQTMHYLTSTHTCPICVPCPQQTMNYLTSLTQLC